MNPNNWYEVYILYREHIFSTYSRPQAEAIWNTFKTAFFRFLLQEFDFEREDPLSKMTKAEVEAAEKHLKTLPMRSLLRVRTAMAEALKTLGASESSCNTYTSRTNQFLNWGEPQAWWPNDRGKTGSLHGQRCSPQRTGPALLPPKLIPGKGKTETYGLKEQQLSEESRLKLRAMMKFLTEPNNPERAFQEIEESTARGYRKTVLLFLGWFHKFHNPPIPLEELNLDLIFPVFDEEFLDEMSEKEQQKFWRKQKANFKRWLYDYRTFLQQVQHSHSPRTWLSKLEAVYAVGRYQWSGEVEHKEDYLQIPLMRQVREELGKIREENADWSSNGRYSADQSQKWPEVPEGKNALEVIQETVVEKLRLKCHPRNASQGELRNPQTLAVCHQRLLMWVLHALIPAHRQQVARTEQVAMSCPILKPSKVPSDGLYQPLPPDIVLPKRHNGTVKANFLCRLYAYEGVEYPEGVWIRIIRDYKTWKTHGDQAYVIPNWTFSDGSHLHDYIEQYLYGYWLPGSFKKSQTYTWWQEELQGQRGQWISSGRAEFNPIDCCSINPSEDSYWSWGNLFLMVRKGLVFRDAEFATYFAQGSLTAIEKWITPHILRSAWATWGCEQGLTEAELRSLAYSMGMTIETLLKIYERCTPEEKRRAIERLLSERLLRAGDEQFVSVEKVIRLALKLNLVDRQKLATALLCPNVA
jgi:hypothetical protein